MVDPSKFKDKKDKGKDKSKEKKKKQKKKKEKKKNRKNKKGRKRKNETGGTGGEELPDEYNAFKEEENFEASEMEMHPGADEIPGADGEDAKKASTGDIETYKKTQEREMREMYSSLLGDIRAFNEKVTGEEDMGPLQTFTISVQAAIYNMAQQRAGVAEILVERYGKNESEALAIADQIARNSGEGQSLQDIVSYVAENLVE